MKLDGFICAGDKVVAAAADGVLDCDVRLGVGEDKFIVAATAFTSTRLSVSLNVGL